MPNNQLPTKSHVELGDNPSAKMTFPFEVEREWAYITAMFFHECNLKLHIICDYSFLTLSLFRRMQKGY